MTLKQAMEHITAKQGFAVCFEWIDGGVLRSDHFPDTHPTWGREAGIATEEEAWDLARRFAKAMPGRVCNVYVIHAHTFTPVGGYQERMIVNR